jgi:hypothetical protein
MTRRLLPPAAPIVIALLTLIAPRVATQIHKVPALGHHRIHRRLADQ